MSEFGGLRKDEKTQHALEGLGSAALAAAVALPMSNSLNFTSRSNKGKKKKIVISDDRSFY